MEETLTGWIRKLEAARGKLAEARNDEAVALERIQVLLHQQRGERRSVFLQYDQCRIAKAWLATDGVDKQIARVELFDFDPLTDDT